MAARSIAKKVSTPRARVSPEEVLFNKVKAGGPVLSKERIGEIERAAQDPTRHAWRRAALASLTSGGAKLVHAIESDREAAVAFAHAEAGIRHYVKNERLLLDVLESAANRIMVLSCVREDSAEILDAARKEIERTQ